MPDILLIQPPIRDFYLTAKRTIPYGLACIARTLMDEGFSVAVFDALATAKARTIDRPPEMHHLDPYYGQADRSPFGLFHRFKHFGYSFEHIGRIARKSNAFLIGISALFTPYIEEALETARAVKSVRPDCRTVLGGHHPTMLPRQVMACPAVDYVLRGEGEVSLPALARAVKSGRPVSAVPGIGYRRPDGSIHISEPAIEHDPTRIPPPADDVIDHRFYRRRGRASIVISTSRGCPMRCSYCAVGASSYLTYRRRPVSAVLTEIDAAVAAREVGFIDFEDENLALDRSWFLQLLAGMIRRFNGKGPELRAMNGLFPPSLDEETIRSMGQAGFKTLNLALATTAPEQLRRFRRPDVSRDFDLVLRLAEKSGLTAVGYVIAGAPHQKALDSIRDLIFLARRRVMAAVSIFYPAPGSLDYDLCRASHLLPVHPMLMRSSALPLHHTTSRREAATLLRLGRILNFIKHVIDRGESLPSPARSALNWSPPADRKALGRDLLAGFFYDGLIRGAAPDGEIYTHRISRDLCRIFLTELRAVPIRGWEGKTKIMPA